MKLEAQSLCVTRARKQVLNNISFKVDAGEVYALLGGNGAGKSTTLLSFLGFLQPSHGSARINGQCVTHNIAAARQTLAYLPESASLYEHLNTYENLRYFLELAGVSVSQVQLDAALDQVALNTQARLQKLRDYSKGMRQKVAIALAILRDTDILLLDEPTSGLDPSAIDELHRIVRHLADTGKAILMVTHDVYGACQVANRIGLLREGQLVDEFSAQEGQLINTETVHSAFAKHSAPSAQSSAQASAPSV